MVQAASRQLAKQSSVMDAQLFTIKQLLILREQIAPFEADFAVTEYDLDFSHMRDHLRRIMAGLFVHVHAFMLTCHALLVWVVLNCLCMHVAQASWEPWTQANSVARIYMYHCEGVCLSTQPLLVVAKPKSSKTLLVFVSQWLIVASKLLLLQVRRYLSKSFS